MSNAFTQHPPRPLSTKISSEHLDRQAILYVRQSTSHQLREHQESTARQYQLTDRLQALGWSLEQITVIDDDLGISGNGSVERPGFQRLLKLVTSQQVGIVLGLEMSRLARNSRDWHDLFEVCAIFKTLIADEDGVFHPHDPNDRLVLGLKGIISEMELHTMKVRLERGRLSKAQRGEIFHSVPVGFVLDDNGLPQLDPDAAARHVMQMFFDLFPSLGSAYALFRYLAEHDIRLPFRDRGKTIDWRLASKTTVYELLKHPLYAGAYGYGRKKSYTQKQGLNKGAKYLSPEQWKVFLKDQFPAYISWEQYEANQRRMQQNDSRQGQRGSPPRHGSALLGGMLFCSECGRRLAVSYQSSGRASYHCGRSITVASGAPCKTTIAGRTIDAFIAEKLLEVLQPAAVQLSLQAIEDEHARREQWATLHAHRVEQARYGCDLAQRRYQEVDPSNRLVAATLEQQWEAAMRQLQDATTKHDEHQNSRPVRLADAERTQLQAACENISALWRQSATSAEKKQIVQLLLERVVLEVHNNSDRVSVVIHWSGGFESRHEITRPVMRFDQQETYQELIARALELALAGESSSAIAKVLEAEGYRSPRSNKPVSADMVNKLMLTPECRRQLCDPILKPGEWRSADLARKIGVSHKKLKDWGTKGWVTVIQRPHGRTWVIFADEGELKRLQQLAESQTGQGRGVATNTLRKPASQARSNRDLTAER